MNCYYTNPYARTLDTKVTAVVKDGDCWLISTEQTIFYPEGGGQPGDRGTVALQKVFDTRKQEDTVFLVLKELPRFAVGDTVRLELDWDHRYNYMQRHTAQHLISSIFYTLLGINTVSVHLGETGFTVETNASTLSQEDVLRVVARAREIIRADVSVVCKEVSREEAEKLNLRRDIKTDSHLVRLVSIDGTDLVACGGVHVAKTGELDLITYEGSERIRGQVRTSWKVASDAVKALQENREIVGALCALLSVEPHEITQRVSSLITQLIDEKYQRNQTLKQLAQEAVSHAVSLETKVPIVVIDVTNDSNLTLKAIAETIPQYDDLALVAVKEESNRIYWMVGLKGNLQFEISWQCIKDNLLPIIEGKGGGSAPLWQGMGMKPQSKQAFLEAFTALVHTTTSKELQ